MDALALGESIRHEEVLLTYGEVEAIAKTLRFSLLYSFWLPCR
jgi:hypothetical protein